MILRDPQLLRYIMSEHDELTWGLCHGCFDLFHVGHVAHLKWASENCDQLIVSLTPDWAIRKGPGRPLFPLAERMRVLDSIVFVDWVVPNNAQRATLLLAELKPDIYFKGPDRRGTSGPGLREESGTVEGYGGTVMFSLPDPEYHSSDLIRHVLKGIDKSELPR